MIHSYDWIIGGLTLDVAGGLILAKGFMLKRIDDVVRESRTTSGGNASLVRSALHQRSEAILGGSLLALGFAAQVWGNFHGGPAANELGWINSAGRFGLVGLVVLGGAYALMRLGHLHASTAFRTRFSKEHPWDAKPESWRK